MSEVQLALIPKRGYLHLCTNCVDSLFIRKWNTIKSLLARRTRCGEAVSDNSVSKAETYRYLDVDLKYYDLVRAYIQV